MKGVIKTSEVDTVIDKMNNLNEMFGKIDQIHKIRKTHIQNTVVDKMNNLNEDFGKIMFGTYGYSRLIFTIHMQKIAKKYHNVFSFRKNSKSHG